MGEVVKVELASLQEELKRTEGGSPEYDDVSLGSGSDSGRQANDGTASSWALEVPGKYLSSKSALSEITVRLVTGL
ncbi:hypothetical protein AGABI1DRAFT_135312 [Agaricus bisporus var. burnettii JB137-S8]|uniref:Uncharacterized protein n=1 Tax=Agaricus bisporus var. burnettii (strain JB137-S8 / ATCC MYA-4627 / FGSC 10392) TaxID=597362 RepID=K5VFY7_AGABU|nr:uncharacterized protein AGABI1DRAFT_135312 [Agaricus bisporus var. burnettii JB137-S8]EKM73219.1 hypothetical protein AGABI1DRAFT_135312 [Agaricus bisporus var. burnettii JB137-S8]